MTVDSSGNKTLHPFFQKMQPKATYKRTMPPKSHSDPPKKSVQTPLHNGKENARPAFRSEPEPCIAESSTSASKRYAKYRETVRDQRRQEQRQSIIESNLLTREEQFYLDFYGPEPEPTPQQRQQKREPMWPDKVLFRGGHVRQLEDEEMFSPSEEEEAATLAKSTCPIQDIIAKEGTSFFQTMADRWKQPISEKPANKKGKQKQDAIVSRDDIERIMDQVYREYQWKENTACRVLFDTLDQESGPSDIPWTEKYRPQTVQGLLGDQRSFNYMLNWLRQLKVACCEDETQKEVVRHDYDDFDMVLDDDVVLPSDDSDDSDFEMKSSKRPKKRIRKDAQASVRSNLMLIFGGCGVGKTASVYTLAQQLGYEVFEINAGMRRSGKDVMAAVGEMTESHHVTFAESSQPGIFSSMLSAAQPKKRQKASAGNAKKKRRTKVTENKSGSIMSHFARISIKHEEAEESDTEDMDVDVDDEPVSNGKQGLAPTRQSLILLEEVDLLYEEDKGFWAAVQELAQKSKRPIIMTCNDTDTVPTETLKLEKAIHIAPQTTKSLMPYLQLLCFKEGYGVDPSDLLYLVAMMGSDLRQLIHTLEAWCKQPDDHRARFQLCPELFSRYMATHSEDLAVRLATDVEPSDVDLYELCWQSNKVERRRAITVKEFFGSDLLAVCRALETAAFADAWVGRRRAQVGVDESEGVDQIGGYCGAISVEGGDGLVETARLIQGLNSNGVQHPQWRAELQEGAGIWGGLCDTRTTAYNECSEALEQILNWRLASNPVCSVLMAEYVPYIRAMCPMQPQQQGRRPKRASRRKQHLKLDDGRLSLLQRERTTTNMTHQWHAQAAAYGDRWHKAATKS